MMMTPLHGGAGDDRDAESGGDACRRDKGLGDFAGPIDLLSLLMAGSESEAEPS